MEKFTLEEDINLFCTKAESFPDGILSAHQQMAAISKPFGQRKHFGVSYLNDNKILYMAATELTDQDKIPEGCQRYTLKKGIYTSIFIKDFVKDSSRIGEAFKVLLEHPNIDDKGCCVECYLPEGTDGTNAKDVRCMIRLKY